MAAEQLSRLRLGAISTALLALLSGAIWGRQGAIATGCFGAVATGVQLVAAQVMARQGGPVGVDRLKVYIIGVLLRLVGVAVMGGAIALDRNRFPAGPTAMGYVGAILPLLYLETRLTR